MITPTTTDSYDDHCKNKTKDVKDIPLTKTLQALEQVYCSVVW